MRAVGFAAVGLFAALALAVSRVDAVFFTYDESPFLMIRGDVNSDHSVNISDPMALQSFLFHGTYMPMCLHACDANNDERVDASDISFLYNYLFMGGAEPPPPGAQHCGVTPRSSELHCDVPSCDS